MREPPFFAAGPVLMKGVVARAGGLLAIASLAACTTPTETAIRSFTPGMAFVLTSVAVTAPATGATPNAASAASPTPSLPGSGNAGGPASALPSSTLASPSGGVARGGGGSRPAPAATPTPSPTPIPSPTPLPTPTPSVLPSLPPEGGIISSTLLGGEGGLAGVVVDVPNNKTPVPGVVIRVISQADPSRQAVLLNGLDGSFSLSGIPLGTYAVLAEKAGYRGATAPLIVTLHAASPILATTNLVLVQR